MRTRAALLFLNASLGLCAWSQVRVDRPIELTGSGNTDRQVSGLHDGVATGDALNARTLQRGTYLFADVTGGSAWQANIQPAITQPQTGLCLLLRSADANAGPVTLSVNGSPPIAVVKDGGQQLVAGDIGPGGTVGLTYDGTAFQLVSARRMDRKPCPAGTVQVNELYCIEAQDRDTTSFDLAAVICGEQGMRMCSWGQWYAACTHASELGLENMSGDWEWTNSAANADLSVRIVGASSCSQAGIALGWGEDAVARHYRCCFSR